MEPERFAIKDTSFLFGEYLYGQVLPQDRFLCKLREVIDGEIHALHGLNLP